MPLCTGDMGFGATKTYDLEVLAARAEHLPRNLELLELRSLPGPAHGRRYKNAAGKNEPVQYTGTVSGLAVGRTLVAILENYQNAGWFDYGAEVLRAYMGGTDVIR